MDLTEDELKPLYKWIDQIPLSRPKRNIARDFSDGVLVAEVIAHFYPKLVELHNYSGANAMSPKVYNWQTLNARALKKLGFQIQREDFMDVCNCRAGAIERVLKLCKIKMAEFQATHGVAGKGTVTAASRSAVGGPAAPAGSSPGAGGGAIVDASLGADAAAGGVDKRALPRARRRPGRSARSATAGGRGGPLPRDAVFGLELCHLDLAQLQDALDGARAAVAHVNVVLPRDLEPEFFQRASVERLPVVHLRGHRVGAAVVVQLHQLGIEVCDDLSHEHAVAEVARDVPLRSRQRDLVDPVIQRLELIFREVHNG